MNAKTLIHLSEKLGNVRKNLKKELETSIIKETNRLTIFKLLLRTSEINERMMTFSVFIENVESETAKKIFKNLMTGTQMNRRYAIDSVYQWFVNKNITKKDEEAFIDVCIKFKIGWFIVL